MMMKRQREENQEKEMDLAISLMLLTHRNEFQCKTCNRKFSSFQALGGHRASHKKPKLSEPKSNKPKMHACNICGQQFSLGQALGGHMRRHRDRGDHTNEGEGFASINHHVHEDVIAAAAKSLPPVLKRSNSKRVMSLQLDLNLTPLENDLKILFGNKAPRVDLSLF